ncbi:MAG: hypothetical protein ACRDID_03575 [Ktedonobacterales bacterium]
MTNAQRMHVRFHVCRMEAPVTRNQPRDMPEQPLVMLCGGNRLMVLRLAVSENVRARQDATVDFVEHHLTPEL